MGVRRFSTLDDSPFVRRDEIEVLVIDQRKKAPRKGHLLRHTIFRGNGGRSDREGTCPTSNFRSVSRNFCVVKSCQEDSLIESAKRADRCETSRTKLLMRLGINHAGATRAPAGISEIDSRLIDTADLAVSLRYAFGEKRT